MHKIICFDFDDVIVSNKLLFKLPFIGRKIKTFELGAEFIEGRLDPKKFNKFANGVMKEMEGIHVNNVMRILLHMRLQKGARETIESVKKKKYRIVIISTNDEAFIKKFLEKHNLLQHVSHIYAAKFGVKKGIMTGTISGEVIKTEKLGILPKLEKMYKVKRRDMIYVGDGLTDLPIMKKIGTGILFNPNEFTKLEIFTDKILRNKEKKGDLYITNGNDLRTVMQFIP